MGIKSSITAVVDAMSEVIIETCGMATAVARTGRKGAEHFENDLDKEYEHENEITEMKYKALLASAKKKNKTN